MRQNKETKVKDKTVTSLDKLDSQKDTSKEKKEKKKSNNVFCQIGRLVKSDIDKFRRKTSDEKLRIVMLSLFGLLALFVFVWFIVWSVMTAAS